MYKLKILSTIILLGVISFNSKSQVIPDDIADRVSRASYIFEGEVIQSVGYWNARHDFIYTSVVVQTKRIFKGSLDCGTVELILLGGRVKDSYMELDHNLMLERGSKGIFLCVETEREQSHVDLYHESNSIKLEPLFNEQGYIEFDSQDIGQDVIDYWQFQLPDLATAYNLMEVYTQLHYTECRATASADTSLIYTLQNPQITFSGGYTYYEFDLSFSDSVNNIYFYTSTPRIKYDTLTFGSWIDGGGGITVTNTTLLSNPLAFLPPGSQDVAASGGSEVFINIHDYIPVTHLPALSSLPTPAIHIKMKIKDCTHPGDIQAIPPPSGAVNIYTFQPDTGFPRRTYDNVIASNTLHFAGCGTKYISSIVPNVVNAGIKDTVRITGLGFGNTQGKLFLRNANNGGASYCYIDTMDFRSWSDTLIRFYVPSLVDSVGRKKVPGTGQVKIQTALGDSITNPNDSLTIFYGVANSRFEDTVGGWHWVKPMNTLSPWNYGGIPKAFTFRTDTSFSNHSDRMACLSEAIKQWVCLTTVNYILGTDTVLPYDTGYASQDSVCFFKFWQFPDPDSMTIAKTTQMGTGFGSPCNSNFVTEIDMRVNARYIPKFVADTNQTSNIVAGKIDLYQVLLHELGHGHSLTHVNNPKAVMWWLSNNPLGVLAADRRTRLWEDFSASSGGYYVALHSYAYDSVNCHGISRMTSGSQNCSHGIGIDEVDKPNINLSVYPNPTNHAINIEYDLEKIGNVNMQLYDVTGRTVFVEKLLQMGGHYKGQISLDVFERGFYILQINIGKFSYISKVMKS